jgi:hypothetical protein
MSSNSNPTLRLAVCWGPVRNLKAAVLVPVTRGVALSQTGPTGRSILALNGSSGLQCPSA